MIAVVFERESAFKPSPREIKKDKSFLSMWRYGDVFPDCKALQQKLVDLLLVEFVHL